jgi:GT2 family glycosyltransferase
MNKLSIITVNYKSRELTRLLLKGIQQCNLELPFECILVNNSPADGTVEMANENFPWVKALDAPGNIGYGAGINLGMKQVSGEFVLILNADTVVFPGQIEKLVAAAEAMPRAGLLGPRMENPNRSMQRTFCRFPTLFTPVYRRTVLGRTPWGKSELERYLMHDADHEQAMLADWIIGGCLLMRREALEALGGFDERFFMYFEDVDICRRTWEAGWQVVYFPHASFVHYHHRESDVRRPWQVLTNRTSRIHITSAVKYFLKYWGKPLPDSRPGAAVACPVRQKL